MKLKTKEELANLIPPTTGQKRKINNFAILTPALAECIQNTDMSPTAVLLALVDQIKAIAPNSTTVANSSSSSSPSVTDVLLKTMGAPYEEILWFFWASHHYTNVLTFPKTGNLQDEETIQWQKEVTTKNISNPTADLTKTLPHHNSFNQNGAITTMTKLSECMVKHQEAALKNQEEKKDTRQKAWHKHPEIQKNIILLGGVDDQGSIPDHPY